MRCVIIILMGLAGLVQAQPQAPVVWGEHEVIMEGCPYNPFTVYVWGDTIVALGRTTEPTRTFATISISGNNGQSWSPWHVFTISYSNSWWATAVRTSQGIYCCTQSSTDLYSLYRTTNLGNTWSWPPTGLPGGIICEARNDTIFGRSRWDNVFWTIDGGANYSIRSVNHGWNAGVWDVATTPWSVHTVSPSHPGLTDPNHLYYGRAPLYYGPFEPVRRLDVNFPWTTSVCMEFSEAGTGMILSGVNWTPWAPMVAVALNISHDDGVTWTDGDTLTPLESAGDNQLQIHHQGRRWMAVWGDTTRQPGFADEGFWYLFSANDGRSWYPPTQATGPDIWPWLGGRFDFCFVGDRVRLVAAYSMLDSVRGCNYLRWEGQLRVDSLPPVLHNVASLPELIPVDTLVELYALAEDEDSLWQMQAVFRRADAEDSMIVRLERTAAGTYRGAWTAPADTARWLYYYRAEDMWENVSFMPAGGPADPWVVYVGEITSTGDPAILPPASFRLSVYPNPTNQAAVISFSLPRAGRTSLTVYDLAGRRVALLADATYLAGEHVVHWDARGLPSGVYFARLNAGGFAATRKLLLLR